MHSLTLREKIGQLFFIGIPGTEVDTETSALLADIRPGGVCLFARNIREPAQTRTLLESVRAILPTEPFLSLDQEGGLVDRLRRILGASPPASHVRTPEESERFGRLIAEAVRILGFNMDFAPVVDVIDADRAGYSNGLHSRAFGGSADEVVSLAGAFAAALAGGGCLPCLKHFPGLGASQVDSHEQLPEVRIGPAELRSKDLYPYQQLLAATDITMVMVAHAAYPLLDLQETDRNGKLLPSSLSFNIVTNLLRLEMGFAGVAVTDDLEMGAIVKNYGIGEACRMAINAGQDMLAICADPTAIREGFIAVCEAVESGDISTRRVEESQERIARSKAKLKQPLAFDPQRLKALSSEIAALGTHLN